MSFKAESFLKIYFFQCIFGELFFQIRIQLKILDFFYTPYDPISWKQHQKCTILFLEDVSLAAGFEAKHKCTTVYRTAKTAPVVMNLKLHHRQMHYRQRAFLIDFTMKMTTKGIKNMLLGHEKLKIYETKSLLGGINLVGLSL